MDGEIAGKELTKNFPPKHKITFNGSTYFLSSPYISAENGRAASPATGEIEHRRTRVACSWVGDDDIGHGAGGGRGADRRGTRHARHPPL